MQHRVYAQPVYHTPQSNSPASVASSQSHDQHARMYAQPPMQMQQPMYAYPQYQSLQSAYPSHPPPQQHPHHQQQPQPQHQQQQQMMSAQPLIPHQQSQVSLPHQSPAQSAGMTNSPRPQTKLEPGLQRPMDPTALQRSPSIPINTNHNASLESLASGNSMNSNQTNSQGVNPNAAPGPIPATTPLVVRQDNNGVQWIAFEYSRDRVKMEYTIRCDVESVNADNLAAEFKTDNCVYPRACCDKGTYKGNRLQYENECNTVGWALAELNPCLRGKRGLIQRAVDSWRNSNQDPRLRSRRVRRMAKINTRKNVSTSHPPSNNISGQHESGLSTPSINTVPPAIQQSRPPNPNLTMTASTQLHHHHAHPDGSQAGPDDMSGMFQPI